MKNLFIKCTGIILCLLVSVFQTNSQQKSINNTTLIPPVAQWSFDESSGTAVTDSIGMANGVITGTINPVRIAGHKKIALDFTDASADAIVTVDGINATDLDFGSGSFTISLLAKIDPFSLEDSEEMYLILKGDIGSHIEGNGNWYAIAVKNFNSSPQLRFIVDDSITKTQLSYDLLSYPSNQWAHITGVRNTEIDSLIIYLNGTELARIKDDTDNVLATNSLPLVIGNYHTLDKKMNGAIDEIKLFNYALTESEIKPLFEKIMVTSVTVSGKNNIETINTFNGTLQMEKTILPENATDKNVTWSVSNSSIAYINIDGLLTAISDGTVIVTATANDGSGIQGTKTITITNQGPQVKPITNIIVEEINGITTTFPGEVLQMTATVLPDDATDKSVTWFVSNELIAYIDYYDGWFFADLPGKVTVTAIANDGSGVYGSIEITIINLVNSIYISGKNDTNEITTQEGTLQMEAFIYPDDATNKSVIWKVSNETIATIDSITGILTAKSNGIVVVTATAQDGSEVFGNAEIKIKNQIIDKKMVAYWKFDETSGDTVTDEVGTANGIVTGTMLPTWIPGKINNALDFSKASDDAIVRIEGENTSALDFGYNSFSISILAKIDPFALDTANEMYLLVKGDIGWEGGNGNWYAISIKKDWTGSNVTMRLIVDDNITKSQLDDTLLNYPRKKWAHIVGVRNTEIDSLILYIDGVEVERIKDETEFPLQTENLPLVIGNYSSLDRKINGAIDEVKIFNYSLPADEIANMYPKSSSLNLNISEPFVIYPNPVKNILNISYNHSIGLIEIYNIQGKLEYSFKNIEPNVNVSQLKTGIYFIKIESGNTIYTTKFIKQ